MEKYGQYKKFGQYFNFSNVKVKKIETDALMRIRYPTIGRMLIDYVGYMYEEGWGVSTGAYIDTREKDEVVDGIKIESFSNKSNKPNSQEQQKEPKEENAKIKKYLDEITQLSNELKKLDIMLQQTSNEMNIEKIKKQKNKELRKKLKRIESLMKNEGR